MNTLKKMVFGFVALGIGPALLQAQQPPPAPVQGHPPAALPVPAQPQAAPSSGGARIQFQTPVYDFGKVQSGDPVKYTYVFTNSGDSTLYITNVAPGCGCTAAGEWTKQVEPGQTGTVPIQFNSANFNGPVIKTISVTSNDKQQPTVMLQLKGTLWKPIEITPLYTVINVPPEATNASAVVRIVNNMEQPLDLYDIVCDAKVATAEFRTNTPGKEYQLTLIATTNLPAGNTSGNVTLKTSWTNTPTLTVPFWANVQSAIMMWPLQIGLSPAPLKNAESPTVTIQNNSPYPITLSEPSFSVPGVEFQIKEMVAGHTFSVQFTFPAGFESPKPQPMFTVKTTHAQFPLLKVPVVQLPRGAVPQVPATVPIASPKPQQGPTYNPFPRPPAPAAVTQ